MRAYRPSLWRPWLWREWRRVATETGHIPRIGWMLRKAMGYLRPAYHPIYEADTQQALDYLAGSPAARTGNY
jgi:predicted metal-dependent hydrolase